MNLLKQPNEWSCLPTSLAMLAGLSVEQVISEYGHDGSAEVIGNPYDRLCFTDLETVRVAFNLGIHLVPFSPYSRITGERDKTFKHLLECYSGLLVGNWVGHGTGHSLCWHNRHSLAFDPSKPEAVVMGHLYDRYNVEVFFAWVNRQQS